MDVAVHKDHGNACIFCFQQNIVPAVFHDRRERNDIHLVGDKTADGSNLIFLLLLGILEHKADLIFFRLLHDVIGIPHPPRALRADL